MLSRYVQESKNRNGTESEIKLVKLRRVHSCTEGSKRRYLCQERIGKKKKNNKIIWFQKKIMLLKISESVSRCRHEAKYWLCQLAPD